MKKKQVSWFEPYRKWVIGVILSIVVIPTLALSWHNIQAIWANPEVTQKIEKKVMTHEEVQQKLSYLLVEQQARLDKQEEIDKLQVDSLREQLQLVVELKRGKK